MLYYNSKLIKTKHFLLVKMYISKLYVEWERKKENEINIKMKIM